MSNVEEEIASLTARCTALYADKVAERNRAAQLECERDDARTQVVKLTGKPWTPPCDCASNYLKKLGHSTACRFEYPEENAKAGVPCPLSPAAPIAFDPDQYELAIIGKHGCVWCDDTFQETGPVTLCRYHYNKLCPSNKQVAMPKSFEGEWDAIAATTNDPETRARLYDAVKAIIDADRASRVSEAAKPDCDVCEGMQYEFFALAEAFYPFHEAWTCDPGGDATRTLMAQLENIAQCCQNFPSRESLKASYRPGSKEPHRCEECNAEDGPGGVLLTPFMTDTRWRCYDQSACHRRRLPPGFLASGEAQGAPLSHRQIAERLGAMVEGAGAWLPRHANALVRMLDGQRSEAAKLDRADCPNLATILPETDGMPLVDALSRIATWENERAVAQALRGQRDPNTGALWDTCFRHAFQALLDRRASADAIPDDDDLIAARMRALDDARWYLHDQGHPAAATLLNTRTDDTHEILFGRWKRRKIDQQGGSHASRDGDGHGASVAGGAPILGGGESGSGGQQHALEDHARGDVRGAPEVPLRGGALGSGGRRDVSGVTPNACTITDKTMRATPLTMVDFRASSRMAHAFWTKDLRGACHPEAGVKATLHAPAGTIEITCNQCGTLAGVVLVARGEP